MLWILGGVVAEWVFVIAVWFRLRTHESPFKDIGVWRLGTWPAWVMALLFAALSIGSNLRFLPQMHIPVSHAFMPRGFQLGAALLMGITAGFYEEVLFRGFLMTEFATAGYGKVMQVVGPSVAFGLAHAGYLNQGILPYDPGNPTVNFRDQRRSNETHESKTDPEALLARKGQGMECKLSYSGNMLVENRNGLIVDAEVFQANGTGERDSALVMRSSSTSLPGRGQTPVPSGSTGVKRPLPPNMRAATATMNSLPVES